MAISYLPEEESDAAHIVELIEAAGRTAVTFPGDLRDSAYCRALVAAAVEGLGGLDIVVSNAGKQVFDDRIEIYPTNSSLTPCTPTCSRCSG